MKHPVLARVFAVVLAILGVILLAGGISGFGKNRAEHAERLAYEEKFAGRIENYVHLHEQLENAADYEQTRAALNRVLEEHEKAASQHKTDTAVYSATKGGLRMGEQMIVSLQAQISDLREQLKNARSRKAFLEGLLTELIASNKDKMPWLDALANTAAQYAVDSYMESGRIALITGKLRALMEAEPSPFDYRAPAYEEPVAPVLPELPQPDFGGVSPAELQAAWQAAAAQFQSAAAAYQQAGDLYAQQLQDYYDAAAEYEMARLNRARDEAMDAAAEEAYSLEYRLEHAAWEKECENVKREADLLSSVAALRRLSRGLASLVRQANSYAGSAAAESGGFYPGLEELTALAEATAARLDTLAASDLSKLGNAEFLRLFDEIGEILQMISDAFCTVADNLNNPAALIAELMEKLHITQQLIPYLNGMLDKAEHEMQAALEELWYQLGEQEKKALELEAEKLGLDEEAKTLSRQTLDADALKDLRNRHASARLLLSNVPAVKEGTEAGLTLPESARAYLAAYGQESARLHSGKKLIHILAVLGGVMAVAGIPAAYELTKSRFLLLAPVLLCLACAAGAEGLNLYLGEGQQYTALFTAIFALLQLLIVLPRNKKARHQPKHLRT